MIQSSPKKARPDVASLVIEEVAVFGNRRQMSSSVPFDARICDGEIVIRVPYFARVDVGEGLVWHAVHDGQHWGMNGIRSDQSELSFAAPLSRRLRVTLMGRTWVARMAVPASKTSHRLARLAESRYLAYSLTIHVTVATVLLVAAYLAPNLGQKLGATGQRPIPQAKPSESQPRGAGAPLQIRPFEGISYAKFLQRLERLRAEANPLDYFAETLGRSHSFSAEGARGAALESAASGVGAGTGSAGQLSDTVAGQQYSVHSSDGSMSVVKLTEKQKTVLRERFRELQDDFKRIYSKLLAQDPNMSVTVAIQAKVQPNGFLSLSNFKARGNYQPQSLGRLKAAMAEVIEGVFVGPELVGVLLRGESVFVR